MHWAMDRVKKTKKILIEMKIIEVVQKRQYYYVHLFFIYTKKKIGEILGKCTQSLNASETEDLSPKKVVKVKKEPKARLKPSVPSVPSVLVKWIEYCDKNAVRYGKSNLKSWEKNIEKRLTIDTEEAIYNAISKKWKNFYVVAIKKSKYHKFLGKSLMIEKDCDTLIDISYRNKKYIYQFKNIKVTTSEAPFKLFKRYGYDKAEFKTAPIVSVVKDKLLGLVSRF
jgi:hypothetical protein